MEIVGFGSGDCVAIVEVAERRNLHRLRRLLNHVDQPLDGIFRLLDPTFRRQLLDELVVERDLFVARSDLLQPGRNFFRRLLLRSFGQNLRLRVRLRLGGCNLIRDRPRFWLVLALDQSLDQLGVRAVAILFAVKSLGHSERLRNSPLARVGVGHGRPRVLGKLHLIDLE